MTMSMGTDGGSSVRDVTERVRAAEEIARSERRFRKVFDESPLGKVLVDANLRIFEVNQALCRMLRYRPSDLLGRPFTDFCHPDDVLEGSRASHQLVREHGEPYQADRRYIRSDGSVVWGRLTATALFDDDGTLEFGLGTVEDVTEQVETQQALADQAADLQRVLESSSMWTFTRDLPSGRIVRYGKILEQFGITDDTTEEELHSLVHPDDRSRVRRAWAPQSDSIITQLRLRALDGEYRWIEQRGGVIRDATGTPVKLVGTAMDVTREREADILRGQAESALTQQINASLDAFITSDARGVHKVWNPAAERIFGWTADEMIGKAGFDLLIPPDSRDRIRHELEAVAGGEQDGTDGFRRGRAETRLVHRDGHDVWVDASWVSRPQGDGFELTAILRDITERRAAQAEIERLALVDTLTGLPNRALLQDRLKTALGRSSRQGSKVGVLFLDLDRFKIVNDSLGHDAGDELLRILGGRLSAVLRQGETLGRFGGDEFVVIVEDPGNGLHLASLAERILAAAAEPVQINGNEIFPQCSIGIALTESGSEDVIGPLRDADLAMYRAKARGGGSYEIFDEDMRRSALIRLSAEAELRRGITNNQMRVYYQPYASADGHIVGVEALVRWQHPQRGLLEPAHFIGLAEDTGLIVPLDQHVLEEACRQVATWRAEVEPDLKLSVNLSAHQLQASDLPMYIADTLADTGLDGSALCLELTETALIADPDGAEKTLTRLRDLGLRIAVDDFGTGYSSLGYLRRFPIQIVKLDKVFVSGVCENVQDSLIISAVVDLAHRLGMTTIAEGVETGQQLAALHALGCDLTQGYYWSRPLDARTMTAKLEKGSFLAPARAR